MLELRHEHLRAAAADPKGTSDALNTAINTQDGQIMSSV